jgi:hypothetical protein
MNLKKVAAHAAIAGSLSASALGLGLGGTLGTADADTGFARQTCFAQFCHDGRGGFGTDRLRWDQRGFDDGRRDHQPFNYRGHRVEPFFDSGRGGWGFWFFNSWIPF